MAHEMDSKDTPRVAREKERPEEHLGPFKGTPQESSEKDKNYGFLKDLVRHARLAIESNAPAIIEGFAAKSIQGSIQHMKMLLGLAGAKDISKLSEEGDTLSGSYLTSRLFHEFMRLRPGQGLDGRDLNPAKPTEGQAEDEAKDRF